MRRCLIFFRHRYVEFRVPELRALVEMQGYTFVNRAGTDVRLTEGVHEVTAAPPGADPARTVVLEGPAGGEPFSPFWYCQVPDGAEVMGAVCARSVLVKAVVELWGEGDTWEACNAWMREHCTAAHTTEAMREGERFKFHIDYFGTRIPAKDHRAIFDSLQWMGGQWRGTVDLQRAEHIFWVVGCRVQPENGGLPQTIPDRWYFGRQVAAAPDKLGHALYALPERRYIGPTSMDNEMAALMANMAQVRQGDLSVDPFAGTGSILVALSHLGAKCIGMEWDVRVIRDGKENKRGERVDISSNYAQYGHLEAPAGLVCDDFSRWALRDGLEGWFDSIVCDPPYGVRESGKTVPARDLAGLTPEQRLGHKPTSVPYSLGNVLADLLDRGSEVLRVGGRLVFFMPWFEEAAAEEGSEELEVLASHPCLRLLAMSEQVLAARYNRRLVTMEKVAPFDRAACLGHSRRLREAKLTIDAIHAWVFKTSEEMSRDYARSKFRCKAV